MRLHTHRALLASLLILFMLGFVFLGLSALREYSNPLAHVVHLLFHDRTVQLIMWDFAFFFVWVFLWMIDRGRETRRTPYPWVIPGLLAASLMIYAFILTEWKRDGRRRL